MSHKKNLAKYRCCRCGYTWKQQPAPVECPKCRSLYVEWTNYERWKENDEKLPLLGLSRRNHHQIQAVGSIVECALPVLNP